MKVLEVIKSRNKKAIILLTIVLLLIGLFVVINTLKKTVYASNQELVENDILNIQEDEEIIDIYEIIKKNNNISSNEEIVTEELDLEYTTKYQNNAELAKGTIQVLQEGRTGKKQVTLKNTYNEMGELVTSEELESKIIKASIDKIVEVGTANYSNSYKPQKGDKLYITPSSDSIKVSFFVFIYRFLNKC